MANPIGRLLRAVKILPALSTDSKNSDIQTDLVLAVGKNPNSVAAAVKSRPKLLGRTLSYEFMGASDTRRAGTGEFTRPVYDLAEIARAAEVEPYIDQSIRRHREMILKEGYEITGNDDDMVDYIRARLFDIAILTGIPTELWVREAITNLVKFHNSGLVVRRDITRSKGRKIRMYGKTVEPIAGIFILDPSTVSVKVDKFGTPKRWQQTVASGQDVARKRFNPEDVIWITLDKNSGFSFGTPYILPALDDVRALRRLEELAVILASKEVFPLYHYKIGTDALPAMQYEDGVDEVAAVQAEIAAMPLQGNIITSHRHEVTLVSRDGGALDIQPFIDYFESRVLGGLRLSPLDLGRGATSNRACYSGDTETLTDKGWKNHWEIDTDSDLIGTFNPETNQLEFKKATSKYVYPYSGKMYNFKTNATDVLVTPDHDMWLSLSENGKWQKIHAEDIPNDTPFKFQMQAEWKGQGKKLDAVRIGDNPDIPADVWIKFLVYFLKYGKVTPSKNEMKFIVRSRSVSETLKEFIKSLPFDFRIYDNDSYTKFAVNDIDLVKHLSMACSCRTYPKRIPTYIINSSPEDLACFLDELSPTEPFHSANVYYPRTQALAGQIQEIAFKLGRQAKVLDMARKPRVMISTDSPVDNLTAKNIHVIEDYEGDVYCFHVPNHLFVTRRNGKIAIQGNTATNINKNVQDASKDYQKAFSVGITNSLLLPMLLEGGFSVTADNIVSFAFPAIDREELRAHQNHGLQLALANCITCTEFRKDYLNLPELLPEQKADTPREEDAAIDEKLVRVAAAVAPKPASTSSSSTSKKSTATATKTASNRGQPRNQSGTKPAKTRITANTYSAAIRSEYSLFRNKIVSLIESDIDEIDIELLDTEIKSTFSQLVADCVSCGRKFLQTNIDEGVALAFDQDKDTEDVIPIGRRSLNKFHGGYVETSFWKTISPYRDSICSYIVLDTEGNSSRYKTYGALSSLWLSIDRLLADQCETSRRFGFVKAARILQYVTIHMENTDLGDRKTIEINKGPIVYKNLMPKLGDKFDTLLLGSKLIEDVPDNDD